MKPEAYKTWELALSSFGDSEKLSKDGKWAEAADKANLALMLGAKAIQELSEELGIHDLKVIGSNAFAGIVERMMPESGRKHYTPEEQIEWARGTLVRLSAELPPDTFRPFPYGQG